MINEITKLLSKCTDEIIAIFVIAAGIGFVFAGLEAPEWYTVAIGLIIMYYFQKR